MIMMLDDLTKKSNSCFLTLFSGQLFSSNLLVWWLSIHVALVLLANANKRLWYPVKLGHGLLEALFTGNHLGLGVPSHYFQGFVPDQLMGPFNSSQYLEANSFCHHFWVGLLLLCCCTHPKMMTKMAKKCSRNVQLIRGSFGKEILLMNFIL